MAGTNVNKLVLNGNTEFDLTEDTVSPETVLLGETAHDRSGAGITGNFEPLTFKTLTYTGTGTSTNTITFPEIPVCIFSFVNKQRDSYGNFNWTNPFTWNSPYITIYYTGSSSGSRSTAVSYTGNTLALTGSDAGLAMNRSDTEYNIYYI